MNAQLNGKIVAWNVKNGLEEDHSMDIVEKVLEQEPSIVVLTEATKGLGRLNPKAAELLLKYVGGFFEAPYDDTDGRADGHTIIVASRPEYGDPTVVSLAGRNGILLQPRAGFSVLGYHAFDRRYHGTRVDHEAARTQQSFEALAMLSPDAAIIAGDLNSMHAPDPSAQLLRAVGRFTDLFPAGEPCEPQSRIERFGSLAQRLSSMAFGTSLDVFREAGFKDADQQHQGTKSLVGPFLNVQLDHLLTRGDNVNTSDFKIVPAEDLSDHSMVVANFFVR